MVVLVDDGEEENLTMPRYVLEVSAGSGDSQALPVSTEQSYLPSFVPQ